MEILEQVEATQLQANWFIMHVTIIFILDFD